MNTNNNEITIKYYYEGDKLYRLVYKIDNEIAKSLPSSHKEALNLSIQSAVDQVLEEKKPTIEPVKWDPQNIAQEFSQLDSALTSAIRKASGQAAKAFFTPPPIALAQSSSSIKIQADVTTLEAFSSLIAVKYLNPAEKADFDRATIDDKMALLIEKLESKKDPQLFDKIATDFSEFLKHPESIKEINPTNFGKILDLLASVSVPKLIYPDKVLTKLQPYLASNEEFKTNLNLFLKVAFDVLNEKDDLKEDPNKLCAKHFEELPKQYYLKDLFPFLYHQSSYSRVLALKNFFQNLEKLTTSAEIKTVFDVSAKSPDIPNHNNWKDIPEIIKADITQVIESPDLGSTISSLKEKIISNIEKLSFTIKTLQNDGSINTQELLPDMSIEPEARKEKLKKELGTLFRIITENYNEKAQAEILFAMTESMITAGNKKIPFANQKDGQGAKFIHQGVTIGLDTTTNTIFVAAQSEGLVDIAENKDKDILKTQDKVIVQVMAHFTPKDDDDYESNYQINVEKKSLIDNLFDADQIAFSLM